MSVPHQKTIALYLFKNYVRQFQIFDASSLAVDVLLFIGSESDPNNIFILNPYWYSRGVDSAIL